MADRSKARNLFRKRPVKAAKVRFALRSGELAPGAPSIRYIEVDQHLDSEEKRLNIDEAAYLRLVG